MTIHLLLLQFAGSLIAIFALFALARGLRLGGKPRLIDEESVRIAASEVECGFQADRVAIGRGGHAALAANAQGQMILIKRHGNRFAGRTLSNKAKVFEEVDAILVDCGDPHFGKVRLSLDQPSIWVDAINRL